jgi:hypothetical protein
MSAPKSEADIAVAAATRRLRRITTKLSGKGKLAWLLRMQKT